MGVNTLQNLCTVIQHMLAERGDPTLLLATGDLTQDGSPQGYANFVETVGTVGVPIHALPGNHDAREAFHTTLGRYSHPVIDLEHWRIVMLDSTIPGSNDGQLGDDQLHLLESLSQSGDTRHVLVAMHHQPVPVQSDWLDTMAIRNAAAFFEIIKCFPQVRALLWGHVHQEYDGVIPLSRDTNARALTLMATPATSFQFTPRSQNFDIDTVAPGYRWIDLHPDGTIETRVVRISGPHQRPVQDNDGY